MRAVIYGRLSVDDKGECSIEDQIRVCTEYAAARGWEITERFSDSGISGEAIGNRPGFQRVRRLLASTKVDVLLVRDVQRIARGEDLPVLAKRLHFHGVRLIGVIDGADSAAPGWRMRFGLEAIIGAQYIDTVRQLTHSSLTHRAKRGSHTGGTAFGYRTVPDGEYFRQVVDENKAPIVREIFEAFAAGRSYRDIASSLNARGVPSPGANWQRTERPCSSWRGSAIRAILLNERYTGRLVWNRSQWVKDPERGTRVRRERPRSEWITSQAEAIRIVSDELFARAQRRTRLGDDSRLKAGGKPRYVFSGLLICATCGGHYILGNARSYVCSAFINGNACDNSIRVRRSVVEAVLIPQDLLAPDRVRRMAKKMQAMLNELARAQSDRSDVAPAELQALDERIARLRAKLAGGDPDLEPDELQAAIDAALRKRQALMGARPKPAPQADVLALLPRAAELFRRQVAEGLDGNPEAAMKARATLRELFGGTIKLRPEGCELWADLKLHPAALLRQGVGSDGSGGLLRAVPPIPQSIRLR